MEKWKNYIKTQKQRAIKLLEWLTPLQLRFENRKKKHFDYYTCDAIAKTIERPTNYCCAQQSNKSTL
jgi:hypothetical protein